MATEGKNDPVADGRLKVSVADDEAFTGTASQGEDGKFKVDSSSDGDRSSIFSEQELKELEGEDGDEGQGEGDKDAGSEGSEGEASSDAEGVDQVGDPAGEVEPLPEFDPESTEAVDAYDKRYFTEDGRINEEALGAVVFANSQKEGGKPELNAGDYAYLEHKLGLSRPVVDKHIEGQIALRQQKETAFYSSVGGKENYEGVLAWAKDNYTPEQKARFNKIVNGSDQDAVKEQIDLLMARAEKGGYKAPAGSGKPDTKESDKGAQRTPPGRPVSPKKTTASSTPPVPKRLVPFANNEEYRKELREAGNDKAKQQAVRQRLAASTFWK